MKPEYCRYCANIIEDRQNYVVIYLPSRVEPDYAHLSCHEVFVKKLGKIRDIIKSKIEIEEDFVRRNNG